MRAAEKSRTGPSAVPIPPSLLWRVIPTLYRDRPVLVGSLTIHDVLQHSERRDDWRIRMAGYRGIDRRLADHEVTVAPPALHRSQAM